MHQKKSLTEQIFPFISWLQGYNPEKFRNDAMAGLTVAVVLIPQSMAYALLAGLPPVYGLYAAVTAPMLGALWGSLRQLATGPIAIMSLLVLTTLSTVAEPGSTRYIELAFLMAFMVGIIYLLIGIFRLGIMMAFISHSAVRGFSSAAALIITATQLPNFLGVPRSHHEYIIELIIDIAKTVPQIHWITFGIGLVSFGIIYGFKKISNKLPGSLIAIVVTTLAVTFFNLDGSGVKVVGQSPSGLPSPRLPGFDMDLIFSLLGPAIVIALVSFAETYSVGKAISSETKQKVNVDQEFIGQGVANFIGSFFQSYPVAGSFSRTAINFGAGARTGMSSVISSLIVVLALLFFTPLLTNIPKAALAALVISAVLMLFHPKEVFRLWKKNRHDGIVAITVFILALLTKPDYALLIGIVISLMLFLWRTMHPRIVRMTKDPELNTFLNADAMNKPSCPQILQLRSDNSIYFANAEYTIEHLLKRVDEQTTPLKFMLLDLEAVGFVDITGVEELETLLEELSAKEIRMALMGVHRPVQEVFTSSGFMDKIEPELLIKARGDAIGRLFPLLDHEYCRNTCPYSLFLECPSVKSK